jgi:tetratricopeptide (TPR) repeat protein
MADIFSKYKEASEAAIFYSLALKSTADPKDNNFTNERKAGAILENIFPDQPNHPGIAHYIIHNYDNPVLAHLALPTARRYADIAPASAHAQHMPSHIFTRLGLWEESIQSNVHSAESARCYAQETNMQGHWFNEIHAIDYLVYAYLQKGDNKKADEQYQYLKTMQKVTPANISAIAYPFAAIPARMALENKRWTDASNLELHDSNLEWDNFPWQKAILHFAKALGMSHTGSLQSAENELKVLQALRQQLVDADDKYSADQVLVQEKIVQAFIDYAIGNTDEALALMYDAANLEDKTGKHPVTPGEVLPARELLGDMLLALNKPDEALVAYEKNLVGHPNRFNGIYGAAVAAKRTVDNEKARMYFESLLKLTETSGSDRSEIEEARIFLEQEVI